LRPALSSLPTPTTPTITHLAMVAGGKLPLSISADVCLADPGVPPPPPPLTPPHPTHRAPRRPNPALPRDVRLTLTPKDLTYVILLVVIVKFFTSSTPRERGEGIRRRAVSFQRATTSTACLCLSSLCIVRCPSLSLSLPPSRAHTRDF
jgi:hypothetical protein